MDHQAPRIPGLRPASLTHVHGRAERLRHVGDPDGPEEREPDAVERHEGHAQDGRLGHTIEDRAQHDAETRTIGTVGPAALPSPRRAHALDGPVAKEEHHRAGEQADDEDGGSVHQGERRFDELEGDRRDERADAERHDEADGHGRQSEAEGDLGGDHERGGPDEAQERRLNHACRPSPEYGAGPTMAA